MTMECVTLKNGIKMPMIGYGVFRNIVRICHQAEVATYAVRCTCIRRSVYVHTAFGVHAYSVRRTSSAGAEEMKKQA